jgi:glycosyltransferase involved in cell wall biosynthesis
MVKNKKVIVVMPAYNAGRTLEQTFNDIPFDLVDEIVLVDDGSTDNTIEVAQKLNIKHIIKHEKNLGYGGNQKTCYNKALELGADIVVMLHPDYQYDPRLIPALVSPIAEGVFSVVMGSRILGRGAMQKGMPVYKYFFNRCLTLFQNLLLGQKLSEYHSGYRAFDRKILERIHFMANSNDFIFDNQMLLQIIYQNETIGEISCPAKYFEEASSINFTRSTKYGLGIVKYTLLYCFVKMGFAKSKLFKARQ